MTKVVAVVVGGGWLVMVMVMMMMTTVDFVLASLPKAYNSAPLQARAEA